VGPAGDPLEEYAAKYWNFVYIQKYGTH